MSIDINKSKEQLIAELKDLRNKSAKKESEKLKKSEEKYRHLTENIADVVFEIDKFESIKYMSPNFQNIVGFKPSEYYNANFSKFVYPEDIKHSLKGIKKHREGSTVPVEFRIVNKNGKLHWVSVLGRYDADRDVVIGVLRDITERKKVEDALFQSEQRYDLTMQAINDGMWDWDIATNKIFFDDRYYTMAGYKPLEFPCAFEEFQKRVHSDDIESTLNAIDRHVKKETSVFDITFRFVKKDGSWMWIRGRGKIIEHDRDGNPLRMVGTHTDVTARKKTELKLKESEESLRDAQRIANIGNWFFDLETGKVEISDQMLHIIGIKDKSEASDVSAHEKYYTPESWKRYAQALDTIINKGKSVEAELEFSELNPNYRYAISTGEPIFDENNKVVAVKGTLQDITERKKAEVALKKSETKLKNIFENSTNLFYIHNLAGEITFINPQVKELLGYEPEEVMQHWTDFITDNPINKRAIEYTKKAIETGRRQPTYELEMQNKKGEKIIVEAREAPLVENGEVVSIVGSLTDITERKQAEEKVSKLNALLNQTGELAKIGGWELDLKTNLFYFTDEMYQIYEITPGRILSLEDGLNLYPPETQLVFQNALADSKERNAPFTTDALITTQQSNKKWVRAHWKTKQIDGKVTKLIGTLQDITKRKLAEKELKESLEREKIQADIVRNTPVAVALGYPDGSLSSCNQAFMNMTGYTEEELKTIDWSKALTPSKWQEFEIDELKKLCPENNSIRYEKEYIHKNGTIFPVEIVATAKFDDNGDVNYLTGFITNISERKEATRKLQSAYQQLQASEQQLQASNQQLSANEQQLKATNQQLIAESNKLKAREEELSTIFNTAADGMRVIGPDFKIKKVNDTFCEMVGLLREDIIGMNCYDIFSGEFCDTEDCPILRLQKDEEKGFEIEMIKVRPDSKKINTIKSVKKLTDEKGKFIGIVEDFKDITERKKASEELLIAKNKAEESDRLKSAFLSNMSHEIRTPMNGILGFTDLLKKPQLSGDTIEKYIQIIEKSGKRMLNTINDIVDISKIEAGQVEVSKTELSINKMLDEQYNFFVREANNKQLEINYKPIIPDSDSCIICDKHKLEGILTNLIKNAIKYTESGSITFGCRIKAIKGEDVCEFYVKDTGIGVPTNRIDAIFNRFEQADIEDARVYEGSGLGLAISKSYVEMLGGTINVNSIEGKGTTFTFYIPYIKPNNLKTGSKQNREEGSELSLKNLSIIVAEDDDVSRIFLETILENEYRELLFAATGIECIDLCKKYPDTDIILMDIRMPDMNGFDATKEIRKFNQNVIIIAQTAHGLTGDKERALEAGCNDYIAKPINKEKLFEIIRNCLKKNHGYIR